jgi:hypothetical protein
LSVPLRIGWDTYGENLKDFKDDFRGWRSLGDSNPCFRRERAI